MTHDAHDPHGHDAHGHAAAPAATGPVEIPPAPETRFISPARSDFEREVRWHWLLWPVVWFGVATGLYLAYCAHGWHEPAHDGAEHHAD
jgi:hypothetical protein